MRAVRGQSGGADCGGYRGSVENGRIAGPVLLCVALGLAMTISTCGTGHVLGSLRNSGWEPGAPLASPTGGALAGSVSIACTSTSTPPVCDLRLAPPFQPQSVTLTSTLPHTITYEWQVSNRGDLAEVVPIAISSSQGWDWQIVAPVLPLSLPAGTTATIRARLVLSGTTCTDTARVTDTLTIRVSCESSDAVVTATAVTTVLCRTELALEKYAQPEVVRPGEWLTYTLAYGNAGSFVAQGVVITDVLPSGVTVVHSSPPPVRVHDSHTLIWEPSDLVPGDAPSIITIVVASADIVTGGQRLTNTAAIIASNAAPVTVEVPISTRWCIYLPVVPKNYPPKPDLSKMATWRIDNARAVLFYTIGLTNTGISTATDVRLTDMLPVGTTYISGSLVPATGCEHEVSANRIVCTGLTMGISETITVSFGVNVTPDAPCPIDNVALVEDGFYSTFAVTASVAPPAPLILNGGFETGDLACWQSGGDLPTEVVTRVWKSRPCLAGQYCARLGGDDDTFPHVVPADTYGAIWQTIVVPLASEVPHPEITLHYRVFSHDRVYDSANDRYYDDFEVSIDRAPGQITNDERDSRGCNVCDPYPAAMTVPVSSAGLVLCGGNRTCARPLTDDPYDTGWLTVTLQLDAAWFGGKEITLYLANWNRRLEYWNTWTYVDSISTNW